MEFVEPYLEETGILVLVFVGFAIWFVLFNKNDSKEEKDRISSLHDKEGGE